MIFLQYIMVVVIRIGVKKGNTAIRNHLLSRLGFRNTVTTIYGMVILTEYEIKRNPKTGVFH